MPAPLSESYCPHCPAETLKHPVAERYLNDSVQTTLGLLQTTIPPRIYGPLGDAIWHGLLRFLKLVRIVSFDREPPAKAFSNRSWIFFEEAKKRGLDISAVRFLGKLMDEFFVRINGKGHFYSCTPLHLFQQSHWIDHKPSSKRFLRAQGLPLAEGEVFRDAAHGQAYGLKLGFPLVVKPENGSLSAHVTCRIQNADELRQAITIAQDFQPGFIVERWIAGDLHRVSILGQDQVFVCRKIAPNIVGDGTRTIAKLVDQKNQHPYRQTGTQTTLHTIVPTDIMTSYLEKQGYTWDTILTAGLQVFLADKAILLAGCDIIDCTNELHPETRDMLLRAARGIEGQIVGIDYITPDIKTSYKEQDTAILELNSRPYLDMHQYPSEGEAQPIARTAWDIVLAKL
jgi:D-alanine-D-alanine ligase-like ATP-grasp enzyme